MDAGRLASERDGRPTREQRVVVLTAHDLDDWRRRFLVGQTPARLPYGLEALEERGYSLTGVAATENRSLGKLRDVLEHRTGLLVERAVRATPQVGSSAFVLALLEKEAMLPAMLRQAHVPPYSRTPLVLWSVYLAERALTADAAGRRALRRRVQGCDVVTHFAADEHEVLVDLGLPAERLVKLTWGVNHEYYVPGEGDRDIPLLSIGQDEGRDYRTLFAAVGGTGLSMTVVCKPDNLRGLEIPANVTVLAPVSMPDYRRLLQRAQVVAVPTHRRAYPTGSSVLLEAASSGCCVVATGTPALSEYVDDGVTGRLIPEHDAGAWRRTLQELHEDRPQQRRLATAARAAVESRFNARRMWTELDESLVARGLVQPG